MPQPPAAPPLSIEQAEPITVEEFGKRIKAKYPTSETFKTHTDKEVGEEMLRVYPQFRTAIKTVPASRFSQFMDRSLDALVGGYRRVTESGLYQRGTKPGALIGGAVGGIAGGTVGATVGGIGAFPGAVAGASAGAAGGMAIQDAFQRPGFMETAKDVGSAALLSGATEAATGGVGRAVGGAGRLSRAGMKRAAGLLGKEEEWREVFPGAVDTMIGSKIGLSTRGVKRAQTLGKAWSTRVDRLIEAGDRAGVQIPVRFSEENVDLLEDMLIENVSKVPKAGGVGVAHAPGFSDLPVAEQQLIVSLRHAASANQAVDLPPSIANMVKRQLQAFARKDMNKEAGRTLYSGRTLTQPGITAAKAFQRDLNTDIEHYLTQGGVTGYKAANRQVQNYMGAAEAATEATGTKPFKWPKGPAVATAAGAWMGKEIVEEPYWGGGAGLSMGLAAAILNSPKAMNWIALMLGNPEVRSMVLSQLARGGMGLGAVTAAGQRPAPAPAGR